MKNNLFLASMACLAFVSFESFAKKDHVIAKYNGNKIYQSEIENLYSNLILKSTGKEVNAENAFSTLKENDQERLVRGLIGTKLLDENVKNSNIKESKEYKNAMKEAAEQIAKKVFIEELIGREITEKKLKDRYKEVAKVIENREEVKASHILVKSEEEAKIIQNELKKGASFAKLASEKSVANGKEKNGELGYFTTGQMVKPFEDAAFSMKVGEISNPVKTDLGWHVIKLEDRRKMKMPEYAEVKNRLKAELSGEILQKYLKSLEDKASIQINLNQQ